MLTLAMAQWAVALLVVLFVVVSVLMILVVLVQRPQGGGLSEAFGSNSGSGASAFGAKTGDALTTLTIGVFLAFLVMAVILNFVVDKPGTGGAANAANAVTTVDDGATDDAAATEEDGGTEEAAGGDDDTTGGGEGTEPVATPETPSEEG